MGYTPVFDSVFTGTLHGRWPDTGLWLCILAMADKHGHVDCTPAYIASVTGLTVDQVEQCIKRFMEPDQYSRTQANDGRRLVLVDPSRPWGWVIVNHGKYREKARLQAKSAREVESGENRERMGQTAAHRRSPPVTAAHPLSNTDTNIRVEARKETRPTRLPEDWELSAERREIAVTEGIDPERTFANFKDYWTAAPGKRGLKSNWDATWRVWCRSEYNKTKTAKAGEVQWG